MEEKVLIKSEQYNIKKLVVVLICICALISIVIFASCMLSNIAYYESCADDYSDHFGDDYCGGLYDYSVFYGNKCDWCRTYLHYSNGYEYAFSFPGEYDLYFLIPIAVLALIIVIYFWLCKYEMTVTDKRIYGKTAFGKKVDLPIDSVSATASIHALKCVTVSTSSGKIVFLLTKNAEEIYTILNNLLLVRQHEKDDSIVNITAPQIDEADQLKKFKELLDEGIITQDEFDVKKKELLGL